MPYKDPEKRKKVVRDSMRRARGSQDNVTPEDVNPTGYDMETGTRIPAKSNGTIETNPSPGHYWDKGCRRVRQFIPSWEHKQKPPAEYHIDKHPYMGKE